MNIAASLCNQVRITELERARLIIDEVAADYDVAHGEIIGDVDLRSDARSDACYRLMAARPHLDDVTISAAMRREMHWVHTRAVRFARAHDLPLARRSGPRISLDVILKSDKARLAALKSVRRCARGYNGTVHIIIKQAMAREDTAYDVMRDVAHRRGFTFGDIKGRSHSRPIVAVRYEAMWTAHEAPTCASYAEIGRLLDRDHTTVMYGVRAHAHRNGLPAPCGVGGVDQCL